MSDREYPTRPIVGIGVCVLRGESVLLVRRGRRPSLGAWSLPGGAQKFGETAEAAARRELLEETGVEAGPLYLAAVVDSIHRDERGAVAYHYTIVDYCARWEAGEARSGGDVTEARFVELDELYGFGLEKEAVRVIGRAKDVFLKNGKKTF